MIWHIIEASVNVIETGLYVYLINSKFIHVYKSIVPSVIFTIFGATALFLISILHIEFIPDFIALFIIILIYTIIFLKGIFGVKLFWCILGIMLICACALAGISITMLLPNATIDIILTETSSIRLQGLIICKMLQLLIFWILAKWKSFQTEMRKSTIAFLLLLTIMSFITILMLFFFSLSPDSSIRLLFVFSSLSILLINILVLALYDIFTKQAQKIIYLCKRSFIKVRSY